MLMVHSMRILIFMSFLQLCLSGKAGDGRFHLFSDETKTAYPSAVYDFLERYLYEIDSLQTANPVIFERLNSDKVIFKKGNAGVARDISPDTPCTVRLVGDKFYESIWYDFSGNEVLHIVFPVNYELILGMSKNKIEKTMKSRLLSMPKSFVVDKSGNLNLVEYENGVFVPANSSFLDIESLNTNVYYSKTDGVDEERPIFDSLRLAYSAANLLQGFISDCGSYRLNIYQNLYDFKHEEYTISLSQWLNYCREMHAVVYAGVEEEREDGIKMLLLVHSRDLGFRHMLSVILPWNFVDKPNATLKARLYAFIPIHNVTAIYHEKYLQDIK